MDNLIKKLVYNRLLNAQIFIEYIIWNWLVNDAPLNMHFLLEMKSTWQKSKRWIQIICGGGEGEGIWNDRGWALRGEGGGDKNPLRLLKETIFLLLLMFRPSELLSLRTIFLGHLYCLIHAINSSCHLSMPKIDHIRLEIIQV